MECSLRTGATSSGSNSNGLVTKTYDLPGEDSWYALALDTTGAAFWAAGFGQVDGPPATNIVRRFDLATGAQLGSFNTGRTSGVLGLAVFDANRFFPPGVSPAQTLGGAGPNPHSDPGPTVINPSP